MAPTILWLVVDIVGPFERRFAGWLGWACILTLGGGREAPTILRGWGGCDFDVRSINLCSGSCFGKCRL